MPLSDTTVIVGFARTPIGAFQGGLCSLAAPELGSAVIAPPSPAPPSPPIPSMKSSSVAFFLPVSARLLLARPRSRPVSRLPLARSPSTKSAAPA